MEEGKSGEKRKVMVAIDESENSNYALEWALEKLRETIADSDVIIFTSQPKFDLGSVYASTLGAVPVGLITSLQENQKKVASLLLDKAKDKCAKYGEKEVDKLKPLSLRNNKCIEIVAETVKEIGDPKYAICEAVEKLNIELLVLGSHNRGPVQRAFLGSVSNYCVNNAKCPVLVVKIPAV